MLLPRQGACVLMYDACHSPWTESLGYGKFMIFATAKEENKQSLILLTFIS